MNEFNFRVANAAPRASVFEIGQNVGDTKTTYIYSYKTKYINGKSTGQKTNVDWDMEKKNVVSFRREEVTTLDLSFAGAGETTVVGVESITYEYINGNLAQEYAANWEVESQNLPSGSTIKTSEAPSQLTITVPANNTSSTRSGKIVLLQPASGKRITLNYSQVPQRYIISTKYFCVGNPDNGNYFYDASTETYDTHVNSTLSKVIFEVFRSNIYSDGTIETEGMGTTNTFEISLQSPLHGGFYIAPDQTQGTDSTVISTKGGSSGTYFGWFSIQFSYGDIIANNRINLYQY